MKRTNNQIRCQFFKELSATERLKVLRVFLDIPDAAAAEVKSHSIESKLLTVILRPTAPASGVDLPFPALPLPIAKHDVIGHLFDRTAMHQYALRYADLVVAAGPAKEAARYRWLRDKSEPGICSFYLSVGKAFDGIKFTQDTVDAAIDAQIAVIDATATSEPA